MSVDGVIGGLAIRVERLDHAEGLDLPAYETEHAAGMDLRAAVPATQPFVLAAGKWALIPTGLKVAIPPGFEAQVRPRSGLAMRHGITALNAPGTIDADYRGEVKVLLINLGEQPFTITRGERIAQMVVAAHASVDWLPVDRLDETKRGEGGFGSTGR